MSGGQRIAIIDGLRGVAVLSVVLYHFYCRFAPPVTGSNWYPYPPLPYFQFGFYGVQLFFVISGFVIFQSLDTTATATKFLQKRLTRLLPAMAICCIISYVIVGSLDTHHYFREVPLNFLFSFTFIDPAIWQSVLSTTDINYIDGAYWSLWVEVVFYVGAAIVFFAFGRKQFLRNWLGLNFTLQCLRFLASPDHRAMLPDRAHGIMEHFYSTFFFMRLDQWIYFSLGIYFYGVYKRSGTSSLEKIMLISLTFSELYFLPDLSLRILFLAVIFLFIIFLHRPAWLGLLKNRAIVLIGLISYPLYLIHQYVGLLLIQFTARLINYPSLNFFIPLFVLGILLAACYCIFTWWERPVMNWMRKALK